MIRIETILEILKKDQNFRQILSENRYYYNWSQVTFANLSYDSRAVDSQTLFFVKGANFKKDFLDQAIAKGLPFYVAEKDYGVGIPVIMVNDIKQAMSLIAMAFHTTLNRNSNS